MPKILFYLFIVCCPFLATKVHAAFSNYSSVLIGDQAAGMGGAYTAMSGDPAAMSYYNPATLARMRGHSLSAAASVYHKFDIEFDPVESGEQALFRVNRGAFKAIPAASGSVSAFGPFAIGLSIVVPDYEFYSGPIKADSTSTSYLTLSDSSLWVGGSFAYNLSEHQSLGLTFYYTSRDYIRTVTDISLSGSQATNLIEEKNFTQNSLLYQFGYYLQITDEWSFGANLRLPSLPISGKGNYSRALISNVSGSPFEIDDQSGLSAETRIPTKLSLGISYRRPNLYALSMDLTYHGSESYKDIAHDKGGDLVLHRETWNAKLGGEVFLLDWLRLRGGLYTNRSSHPSIDPTLDVRQGDHVNMWGLSLNTAFFTSDQASLTFGGYYTGGRGHSTQMFKRQITQVEKSYQLFAMLVSTSYFF